MSESSTDSTQRPTSESVVPRGAETLERAAVELAAAERSAVDGVVESEGASAGASSQEADGSIPSEEDRQAQAQLRSEIVRLKAELNEAKDAVLRAQADVQNSRRRAEKDVENAHKFSLEKFVKELLPVIDSLEKATDAIETADAQEGSLDEGVVLTLKMFTDVLGKFGVEVISPEGEVFNPQLHEAMCLQPTADLEPNCVVAVMQRGYVLNGRLARPARVIVSQALPT